MKGEGSGNEEEDGMPLGEEEPTESTRGSIKPARFRESPTGLGSVTAHGCICHKDLGFGGETLLV